MKKYENKISSTRPKIYFGSSVNSHELERFIYKLKVDKYFINKGCARYHSPENRPWTNILVHDYISKIVNDIMLYHYVFTLLCIICCYICWFCFILFFVLYYVMLYYFVICCVLSVCFVMLCFVMLCYVVLRVVMCYCLNTQRCFFYALLYV